MRRIFDFKRFVINEKRAQLNIPFNGEDPVHDKMHHEHVMDALEDMQIMPPERYTSDANVDDLIEKAIPPATMLLLGESERMKDKIIDFVYQNIENNTNYWEPSFFEENDIDVTKEDFFEDKYEDVADAMVSLATPDEALTDEGKEAFKEFINDEINNDISNMQYSVDQSVEENDGLISVWRAITFTKGEYDDVYEAITKGHHGGIGIYWSWDKDAAEAHWGEGGDDAKLFVLHGQVRPEDVNWDTSVFKTAYDLKAEAELEMNGTAAIKIVGMTTNDDNKKDVSIEFDPAYVVKVGSTYIKK